MINPTPELALAAGLALLLLWTAWTDWQSRTIDHWPVIAIALGAPVFWWAAGIDIWPDATFRVAAALVILAFFTLMFALGQMGGGDVKLITALALWLTPLETLQTALIMSILGGALTLVLFIVHRLRKSDKKLEIPYGLAISFAGIWALGERYFNHFG
jgi:prepilin peptidase CpaA